MLDQLTPRPPEVVGFVGGLSVALAKTFRIIDPKLSNPRTVHWDQVFAIFNLLV